MTFFNCGINFHLYHIQGFLLGSYLRKKTKNNVYSCINTYWYIDTNNCLFCIITLFIFPVYIKWAVAVILIGLLIWAYYAVFYYQVKDTLCRCPCTRYKCIWCFTLKPTVLRGSFYLKGPNFYFFLWTDFPKIFNFSNL